MPLIHTIQAAAGAKVAIWNIKEPEEFFSERVQVERVVHHPHKRLQHLAARYLLEVLEPSFPTRNIRVSTAGKPYLPGNSCYFSLAHSGDYAVAILSTQGPVGIDVEKVSTKIERIAHKFLRPEELAFISPEDRINHLTLCWCAKETIVKWYGKGGIDFRENIRLAPFSVSSKGVMQASFSKDGHTSLLSLQYLGESGYQLAWLADEKS